MTWWDHETGSIWTQPWGQALVGPLKGTQLQVLPFSLVPWETWRTEYPETLAMVVENQGAYSTQGLTNDFVAGVAIGDAARAYPYLEMVEQIVTNDDLNGVPLVIHVNPDTRSIHIFVRQLSDGTVLTFTGDAERMIDDQTGSVWNPIRGVAIEGELAGQGLREIPYISSYDWAWLDFFPNSSFYQANP